MSDVIFIAKAKAKPSKEKDLERALRDGVLPARAQAGCVQSTLCRSEEDPGAFVSVERWKTRADHDRHMQGPHSQKLGAGMGDVVAGPPQIEAHDIVDDGAGILHSIQIAAKPEAIYPLFATADGFRKWWANDVMEADGAVELGFFNRMTIYRLRRTIDRPPIEVEWRCETGREWTGTRIRFRLEAGQSGTLLRFAHADWETSSDYFISCNTTWGELMYRLKSAAQGNTPGPLFNTSGTAY
jgi:quinol monooxygenase YgiN